MNRVQRLSVGLLGQIFVILLLAVVIEFGVSTLLYERASRVSVHEDEAHRLAENLAVAVKLFDATPPKERHALADRLSTERYIFDWRASRTRPPLAAPRLPQMRLQVTAWEPSLDRTALQLRLKSPGGSNIVLGNLQLADGTWLEFTAPVLVQPSTLALNRMAIALVPAIALTVIGALLLRVILRPVRELARAADRIGEGTPILVKEQGPTELRRLTRAFNAMQSRITGLLESRTQALAAVSHDLRTPIARLRLRTDLIQDEPLRRAFADDLVEIDAMLGSLLAFFGREGEPERPTRVDLAVMMSSLADQASDEGQDVEYIGPEHYELELRQAEIKRALANLVSNALHYGGNAILRLEIRAGDVLLAVEDDGPGIPEESLSTVLEPFTRLDNARSRNTGGLGLGLAIVDHAVRGEGGQLTLSNRPSGGLRAAIRLPNRAPET